MIINEKHWHFEENPACRSADISFSIVGATSDPDSITKLLRLKPTTVKKAGETYKSKTGRTLVNQIGKWAVESSQLTKSTSLENHALALLQFLEPRKKDIRKFVKTTKRQIVIRFKWEAADNNYGGFSIRSETMCRLMTLCTDVHFYFIGANATAGIRRYKLN
jgi:Domain of unknown function (DUF4279)